MIRSHPLAASAKRAKRVKRNGGGVKSTLLYRLDYSIIDGHRPPKQARAVGVGDVSEVQCRTIYTTHECRLVMHTGRYRFTVFPNAR